MIDISYYDTVTFYKVTSGGYGANKLIESSDDVSCLFLQNTGFGHSNNQDFIDADAICYPDPESLFITVNYFRLEGMYVLAPMFDAGDDNGWYKVTAVTVNKDILLENQVGNIELALKKTARLRLVS